MPNEGEQFLVIFRLGVASPARVSEFVPQAQAALQKISTEPIQLIVRSVTADVFVYGIRSRMVPGQIKAHIESPGHSRQIRDLETFIPPFLAEKDAVLVVQLESNYDASGGFYRELAWLQHH